MESVSEYIDKTEMLIRLKCLEPKKDDFKDDDCFQAAESQHDMICEYLKPMQPADVASVIHGRWIQPSNDDADCNKFICSICGYEIFHATDVAEVEPLPKHCEDCGAKMDEEKGENIINEKADS